MRGACQVLLVHCEVVKSVPHGKAVALNELLGGRQGSVVSLGYYCPPKHVPACQLGSISDGFCAMCILELFLEQFLEPLGAQEFAVLPRSTRRCVGNSVPASASASALLQRRWKEEARLWTAERQDVIPATMHCTRSHA